jgi:hypothetical protein
MQLEDEMFADNQHDQRAGRTRLNSASQCSCSSVSIVRVDWRRAVFSRHVVLVLRMSSNGRTLDAVRDTGIVSDC